MPKRPDLPAWLTLGFIVVVSSINPIAIKIGLRSIGPLWMISIRLVVAALVMTVLLHGRVRLPRREEWPIVALIGLLGWTVVVTPITWAAAYVPAAVLGMTMATTPLFALLLGVVAFGQARPRPIQLAGLLIGFAGVAAVILLRDQGGGGEAGFGILPYLALVGAMMVFTVSAFISARASHIPGLTKGLGALYAAGIASTLLAIALEPLPVEVTLEGAVSLTYLSLVATGLNGLAIYWLVDRTSPQFMALSNYLMPVGNIVLAMAVLGEILAPGQYVGVVVILVGMALSEWRPRAPRLTEPAATGGGEPAERAA